MNGKKPDSFFFHRYLAVALASLLVLVGAIGVTAQIIVKRAIVDEAEHHAAEIAEAMSIGELSDVLATAEELGHLSIVPEEIAELDRKLSQFLLTFNILNIKMFDHNGTIIFSTDQTQIGSTSSGSYGLTQALHGKIVSEFEVHGGMTAQLGHSSADLPIVETYIPLRNSDQKIVGAFELYTDVLDHLNAGRMTLQTLVFWLALVTTIIFGILSLLVRRLCNSLSDAARLEDRRKTELLQTQQKISATNTKLHAANERLIAAEGEATILARDAIKADTAKTSFLANMSHEMRTPLTAILGYADLIADPDASSTDLTNNLAVIRRNGKHLLSLIEDILDLATIEEGRMSLRITACNTLPFVDDIQTVARLRAVERGLDFQVKFLTPVPELIFLDATRLKQALLNLLSNAVKFTRDGAVNLEIEFVQLVRGERPVLRFHVVDTGIGITAAAVSDLFRPFQQIDDKFDREFDGTGLGLAITKQIAEVLGGDIAVTSEPGAGSRFVLTIAVGDVAEQPLVTPETIGEVSAEPVAKPKVDLSGLSVLYAEDGLDNQFLVKAILRKAGAKVELAPNGAIAVEMATEKEYDIILMDIQMPVMDGLEATRLIRQNGYQRSIVALTANAMANDRRLSAEAGCVEHLTKPINRMILLETVRDHCRDLVVCEPSL